MAATTPCKSYVTGKEITDSRRSSIQNNSKKGRESCDNGWFLAMWIGPATWLRIKCNAPPDGCSRHGLLRASENKQGFYRIVMKKSVRYNVVLQLSPNHA
mmetsp:Transcript_18653/g.24229  ORF Transcript_18653/g.24229 Transcript_18653/m.24229 type:complete len:100 (-) Transcript_18653:97-396(-)